MHLFALAYVPGGHGMHCLIMCGTLLLMSTLPFSHAKHPASSYRNASSQPTLKYDNPTPLQYFGATHSMGAVDSAGQ
jgi:sulfite exporter TauE/SafE